MKKLMLTLCLVVICSTSIYAECEIDNSTTWFSDADRFEVIWKTSNVNKQQAMSMLLDDLKTGKAIRLEKGTKIDRLVVHPDNDKVCVIRIKNQVLIGLIQAVKCK